MFTSINFQKIRSIIVSFAMILYNVTNHYYNVHYQIITYLSYYILIKHRQCMLVIKPLSRLLYSIARRNLITKVKSQRTDVFCIKYSTNVPYLYVHKSLLPYHH